LGINVGGIPGTDYGFGFWVTCAQLFFVLQLMRCPERLLKNRMHCQSRRALSEVSKRWQL
jgi:hypothetical protein